VAIIFGSNENLFFVINGGNVMSMVTLFDDSSGVPLWMWTYLINDLNGTKFHIVSNVKA
jgi:hypothetical protein